MTMIIPNPKDRARTRPAHLAGIAYGAGAGALWGLVFLAPELVSDFSPLQLSIARYLGYGVIAAVLLVSRWNRLSAHLTRGDWLRLVWLGFTGNTLYYILLASAVQIGGIAMTSLVIGFLPVAVTVIGSRDRDAVPLSKLAPSLLFCSAGALCIGWEALARPSAGTLITQMTGLLCAIGALVSWTLFAVSNSRCLKRLDQISTHDWNLLTGLMTGAQNLLLVPLAFALGVRDHSPEDWMRFAATAAGIAILASIAGNALWNRMSRLLPLTLIGQMILFETLFALIYGFLWEWRLPTVLETAAFGLVVASVLSCLHAHRSPPHRSEANP